MKLLLRKTAIFVLMLSMAMASKAQNEYNKVFNKEFAVNKSTTLYLKNKYGHINVENWDKNSISVRVEVTVKNSNESKAKTMLDAIKVVFSEKGNDVSAVTEFDEDIMRKNKRLFSSHSDQELSINYKVMMPKNVNIDILHIYGDIYMSEFTNMVRVDLKYGNIKIKRLTRGDSDVINTLILRYASADIKEVNWLKFDVRYGKIEIDNARALLVESRYSKYEISSINSLVIDSQYDNFSIESVANVVGESGYSSFEFDKLFNKLELNTKYGDVKIGKVSPDFESIYFDGSYTGFKAGISSKMSYKIDAKTSYCRIKYYAPVAKVNRIEGNTSTEIKGTIGEVANPTASVYIRTRYGNVNLLDY